MLLVDAVEAVPSATSADAGTPDMLPVACYHKLNLVPNLFLSHPHRHHMSICVYSKPPNPPLPYFPLFAASLKRKHVPAVDCGASTEMHHLDKSVHNTTEVQTPMLGTLISIVTA